MVHLGCSMWVCTHLLDRVVAFNLPPLLATVCMVASPQWRCHAYCGSLSASLHSSLSVFPGSRAEGWRWSCHPYGSLVVFVTELRWRCSCLPQPSLQLGCTHLGRMAALLGWGRRNGLPCHPSWVTVLAKCIPPFYFVARILPLVSGLISL